MTEKPSTEEPLSEDVVLAAARCAHQINRAICEGFGDFTQPHWDDAPEWQRLSCIDGVRFLVQNPHATPLELHQKWMERRLAEGWVYGPQKSAEKKQHPALLPYDELPVSTRVKDHLFRTAVVETLRLMTERA